MKNSQPMRRWRFQPFRQRAASFWRGMPDAVQEAGENNRTVLVQFESLDEARAAYASPAYQEALTALGDGAVRDLRIIEAA